MSNLDYLHKALSLSPLTGRRPLSAVVTQTPLYMTVTQLDSPIAPARHIKV